jgi:hypothetical protein
MRRIEAVAVPAMKVAAFLQVCALAVLLAAR